MLTIFQVYSPEVLTAAVEILSMLKELPLLFFCMIMIRNPSLPFTAVPLCAREMDGMGYPDTLHTRNIDNSNTQLCHVKRRSHAHSISIAIA